MTEPPVISARPRWREPKTAYKITSDGCVRAAPGTAVRRITGTTIGALMGLSPFETPFTAQCALLGLNDRDLTDNPAVRTGVALEPRIIDYIAAKHPSIGTVITAEDAFSARKGQHEDWKSDWDDPDFGGHVDAIVSKDGQDYILEIKTVKSIDHWRGEIPPHYLWQVYLYNHFLTRQTKAYFGIGVVSDRDYQDPDNWQPNSRNCLLVEINIDTDAVAAEIDRLREFRRNISDTLTTIPHDPSNQIDVKLIQHLRDYIAGKDEMIALADRMADLNAQLSDIKARYRHLDIEMEQSKARMKDIMLYHDLTAIGPVRMRIQRRASYDVRRMQEDGIDTEPYLTITEVPTVTIRTDRPRPNPENRFRHKDRHKEIQECLTR